MPCNSCARDAHAAWGYYFRVVVRQLIRDVANFAFPPRCALCGKSGLDAQPLLCADCATELDALSGSAMCLLCAMPLAQAGDACPYCMGKGMAPFDRVAALGPFRDPLKKLIHQTKYQHRWSLAEMLADRLLTCDRAVGLLQQADCIVAIPLHWSRQIARGYNQAQGVAGRLGAKAGLRLARPLARLKNTEAQTIAHSRAQRAINLQHAFGLIHPRAIRGKDVIVIDDVMTTGSTLKAAARALKEAKPASLSAIVLAVADPRGRDFQSI